MKAQDHKYSITLDRYITESDDLNYLEYLAIGYCHNEGYFEFHKNTNDVIKISSILKYDHTPHNEYTLIYDNFIEIQVNLDLLDAKELIFIIKQLSN